MSSGLSLSLDLRPADDDIVWADSNKVLAESCKEFFLSESEDSRPCEHSFDFFSVFWLFTVFSQLWLKLDHIRRSSPSGDSKSFDRMPSFCLCSIFARLVADNFALLLYSSKSAESWLTSCVGRIWDKRLWSLNDRLRPTWHLELFWCSLCEALSFYFTLDYYCATCKSLHFLS